MRHYNRSGFTLVEVMIATFIVMITGLAIIAGVVYGLQSQKALRERNGAIRAAADGLETTKRALFVTLAPRASTVLVDDNGTPETTDDLTGTLEISFFDTAGNTLAAIPLDQSMIIVESRVTWLPAGHRGTSGNEQSVVLRSLLAP